MKKNKLGRRIAIGIALGVQAFLRDSGATLWRGQRFVRSCSFQSVGKNNVAGRAGFHVSIVFQPKTLVLKISKQ